MIRPERLTLTSGEFAAERKGVLDRAEESLAPVVADALNRVGLPGWTGPVLDAALEVFDRTVETETDQGAQQIDDLRAAFAQEVTETLDQTTVTTGDERPAQEERVTRWLATAAVNAATEAATAADPDPGVGLEWVSMGDTDVRESHRDTNGQQVPIGTPFTVEGFEFTYPGQPTGPIELWINCVVGSTQVEWTGQEILNATARAHEGTFVHLRTARGHVLTVTPNHPVLTTTGYVPAGRLSPGDNVLASDLPVAPEVDDGPPSAEQVFSALRDAGVEQRVVPGAVNFHGDAPASEVEVVGTYSNLARPVRTESGNTVLVGASVSTSDLGGAGALNVALTTYGGVDGRVPPPGGVGVGSEGASLSSGETTHTEPAGLGTGSQAQTHLPERSLDGGSAYAEFARHLQDALAVGMTPCEVVSIEFSSGSHRVYNLHTSKNYYSANGIAVHNCRCVARPTRLDEFTSSDATFATEDETDRPVDEPENTSSVVVALPATDDAINSISSEDPHCTLLFFGDASALIEEELSKAVGQVAEKSNPVTDAVSGTAVLGEDRADVVLLDAQEMKPLRDALLANEALRQAHDGAQQHPVWIPHVTLGYPETPRQSDQTPEKITFDRLALWHGDSRTEFTLGGDNMPENEFDLAEVVAEDEATDAPEIPEEDQYLPVPWHGVLAPEGTPSGDGRQFAAESLRWRDLPLPLKWMERDADGHDGSVVVGRIDRVWRDGGVIKGEGVFDQSPYGYEAVRLIAEQMIRGVSVDVDDATASQSEDGETLEFSSARVAAATLCAVPAFAEAFVALGPWEDDEPQGEPDVDAQEQVEEDAEQSAEALSRDIAEMLGDEDVKVVAASAVPGLRKDGTPPSCEYCDNEATGYVLHAEGMAYTPFCDEHKNDAVDAAETSTPDGTRDPENINRVDEYSFAISEKPWDGSASRFTDEEWKRSCVLDKGESHTSVKERYALPIREPNGDLSRAGVHAAAARINQVTGASAEAIKSAKNALRRAYRQLDEEPPEVIQAAGETDTFAPVPRKTKDGPGWITHPRPTKRITDYWVDGPGAAKIGWGAPGDFNRCRVQLAKYVQNPDWLAGLCANLHYRALRVWPGQHSGRTETMAEDQALTASVALVESEHDTLPADWFRNPHLDGPTPFTVTDEGRVFGHVATWDTCHIGVGDACVTPPRSNSGYSYFLTGEVDTDAGPVSVGQISLGGGHADLRAGVRAAISHYDSTSTAVADVTAGEDQHGIWVAGAIRPGVTTEQVKALKAAALSGDWRSIGAGGMEMVAALAVNVPGFPIPRPSLAASGTRQTALVAASIPQEVDELSERDRAIVREAVTEALSARERRERALREKERFRQQRLAYARETFREA